MPYDPIQQDARALRTWEELTPLEQQQNEFYSAVIGPLQRRADGSTQYYDLMRNVAVWTLAPGTKVLDMTEVVNRVQNVEHEVTSLLKTERGDLDAIGVSENEPESKPFIFKSRKRAGHHRLPWKSVRRMTAVLQVCWLFLGIQSLLSSMGIGNELKFGRRLASAAGESLTLIDLPISWPHSFFHPKALSCGMGPQGSQIIMESPYVQYQLHFDDSATRLAPVSNSFAGASLLGCSSFGCVTAELEDGGRGLAVWTGGKGNDKSPTQEMLATGHPSHTSFKIQGQPWLKMAGVQLPCADVQLLLGFQSNRTCYVFAGWDGQHLPLVALEMSESTSTGSTVSPRVDAPLAPLTESTAESTDLLALHLAFGPSGLRLWALRGHLSVEAWDLSSLEALGTWKLKGVETCLEATGLCESADGLLLTGLIDHEPYLFRAQIPAKI